MVAGLGYCGFMGDEVSSFDFDGYSRFTTLEHINFTKL
jgi:hypothetical protein